MASKVNAEFWELYKHPKWQEKRLRIMQRAGFICELCQDDSTTLNVHHTYYTRGANPWDYPDDSLRCLCESCHKEAEAVKKEIVELIGRMPDTLPYFVLGLCRGISMSICRENSFPVECGEVSTGMLLAWSIHKMEGTKRLNEIAKTMETISGHVVEAIALDMKVEA